MADSDAELMVAWLTQVVHLSQGASRDNLRAMRHLVNTAPSVQCDLLTSIVRKVGIVSQQGMLELHEEARAMLGMPALQRFQGGRVSMSF